MHVAAQALLGEQDFTSWPCPNKTPFRNVTDVCVYRQGRYVIIDIRANALASYGSQYHGALVEIGAGEQDVNWIAHLLSLKDEVNLQLRRSQMGCTWLTSYTTSTVY